MVISDRNRVELHCPACEKAWPEGAVHCPDDGTSLVRLPAEDDLRGRTLDGRFTVREKLGAGGMGAVYSAWQTSVGREVALKIIHRRQASEPQAVRRFLREAKLASRLSNPHTVSVLDFGQTQDGLLYLAMELLRGRTLAEVLKREGPFSTERLVRVGSQLCDALEAAHRLHIVHRDLKPGNVIVLDDPPGRDLVKVLDFGLAKSVSVVETHSTVSRAGAVLGTPAYMSPEQVLGQGAGVAADLYSLGVILYEMASGHLPYEARTAHSMMMAHVHDAPRPLAGAPPVFESVILRLLRKVPGQRLQSAGMVREALAAAAEQARRPTAKPPVGAGRGERAETSSLVARHRTPDDPGAADPGEGRLARESVRPSGASERAAGERAAIGQAASERAASEPTMTSPPRQAPPAPVDAEAEHPRRGRIWIASALILAAVASVVLWVRARESADRASPAEPGAGTEGAIDRPASPAVPAASGESRGPAAAELAPIPVRGLAVADAGPASPAHSAAALEAHPTPSAAALEAHPTPAPTPRRRRPRPRRDPAPAAAPAAPAPDAAPENRFIRPPVE